MTIKELLARAILKNPTGVAVRFKQNSLWEERTYEQLLQRVRLTAEVLHRLGIASGDHVALFFDNSIEWIELYLAITGLGASAVPMDPKLREQEVAHILSNAECTCLLTTARNYQLIREIEDKLPALKSVLFINGKHITLPATGPIRYEDLEIQMQQAAEMLPADLTAYDLATPADSDVASIIYTSGTTGRPKGAMLTHLNFTSDVKSSLGLFWDVSEEDNFLLVLPLHHAFAFTTCLLVPLASACSISIVESLKTLSENIQETRPSVLIGVPLLLEKMYAKIHQGIHAKRSARLLLKVGLGQVVGRKIIQRMGGRLRVVVSGGAPCDPEVIRGWDRLGVVIREGYGLTEASPVVALNPPEKNKPGTVGKALPGVELKIINPKAEGIGEIAVQGNNVMAGYYKNQEATEEIIHDGWLHTGDLGHLDSEGYLTISGRLKSLIVNREGKNIYPEEVEAQILKSPFIAEALILGYRDQGEKVGEKVGVIVVPDQEIIAQQKPGLTDQALEKLITDEVRTQCSHLAEYKRPRCIQLRYEEFQKTSTQKIKRYLYAINTSNL
ncbi:MAG: AMP-binding protein [Kiritimatiellae bacterium]|nr:AMP-binding protein [Kiritimatiellia bacterium]